ncbi:MAG: hypothetical protein NTX25_01660 [Proteobacteria bacterium]|nr:hypothetical protein [Pseudomonadota bacterium]
MKYLVLAPILLLQVSCGELSLKLENGDATKSQASADAKKDQTPGVGDVDRSVKPGGGPGAEGVCDSSAHYGLNVNLKFELGTRPDVIVTLHGKDGDEVLQSFSDEIEGWRIKDAAGIKLAFVKNLSGAVEKTGEFKLELKVGGKITEQKDITLKMDGCHVEGQSLSFDIPSTAPLTLESGKDYYPLNGGSVMAVDPSTGIAQLLSSTKTFKALEIIRIITEETSNGEVASFGRRPERTAPSKTLLGQFNEQGVDRGPLPTVPAVKVGDTDARLLYGQAN